MEINPNHLELQGAGLTCVVVLHVYMYNSMRYDSVKYNGFCVSNHCTWRRSGMIFKGLQIFCSSVGQTRDGFYCNCVFL